MNRHDNPVLRNQQPDEPREVAITAIATLIILLTFLFVALLT